MSRVRVNLANLEQGRDPNRNSRATNIYAGRIDMLRARAEVLTGKDRALMQMYLENGETFSKMARIAGVNEATISRRIHKLISRLLNGEYLTCLRKQDSLSRFEMQVARDYFIAGLSQRKIAERHSVTTYRIRQTLHRIRRLVQVERSAGVAGKAR